MADVATLIPSDHRIYKHCTAFTAAYLIGEEEFCYPKHGPQFLKKFQNFKIKDGDIFVLTFPKSGTTWMQEIVYLLKTNLDFEKAKSVIRDEVFPYVDVQVWENRMSNSLETVNNLPSPRLIKVHLHLSLFPQDIFNNQCKIIYVSRNVKDTITSYYHFLTALVSTKFQGTLEDCAELFMENKLPYTPYITHVKEAWGKRHEKNIYFTTYEEMKENQDKVIGEVAQFLNIPINNKQIKMIVNHCKFDNMKNNPAVNKSYWGEKGVTTQDFNFMRKGVVGSWESEMSPELIAKIDKWVYKNTIDCPQLRAFL